eukprot:357405-Chlamydomonas_euryale.AAC.9
MPLASLPSRGRVAVLERLVTTAAVAPVAQHFATLCNTSPRPPLPRFPTPLPMLTLCNTLQHLPETSSPTLPHDLTHAHTRSHAHPRAQVRVQLAGVPSMPEWAAAGPAVSAAGALPSFNAYPLPYITTVGEYLMTLPQQLEVLVEAGEAAAGAAAAAAMAAAAAGAAEPDAAAAANAVPLGGSLELDIEELAAEWLDRVATAAADVLSSAVLRIPVLGQQGGLQLAADVEYFNNVLAALHAQPPASLLTVQLFAGLPAQLFRQGAAQAAADGGADAATLRALAGMRGLALDGSEPAAS